MHRVVAEAGRGESPAEEATRHAFKMQIKEEEAAKEAARHARIFLPANIINHSRVLSLLSHGARPCFNALVRAEMFPLYLRRKGANGG